MSDQHAAYGLGRAAAHITIQTGSTAPHVHQFAGFDRAAVAEVDEGVRGQEDRVRRRRSLDEFVYADAWGSPWRPE